MVKNQTNFKFGEGVEPEYIFYLCCGKPGYIACRRPIAVFKRSLNSMIGVVNQLFVGP